MLPCGETSATMTTTPATRISATYTPVDGESADGQRNAPCRLSSTSRSCGSVPDRGGGARLSARSSARDRAHVLDRRREYVTRVVSEPRTPGRSADLQRVGVEAGDDEAFYIAQTPE